MLLRHSLGLSAEAAAIEKAVGNAIDAGSRHTGYRRARGPGALRLARWARRSVGVSYR